MQKIELGTNEAAMLAGEHGLAKQRAMRLLVKYGHIVGATRFVPVTAAHIDSCLYHGPSSLEFVESFLKLDARVSVPTTLNVAAVDVVHPELSTGKAELIDDQRRLTDSYIQLGCMPTLTCAPYQRMRRPGKGDHIAWAESNAIVFANSVLGARTERYGDFTDLCAAIAGFVPYVGLHTDEARLATLVVEVDDVSQSGLERDMYFACIGYCLGKVTGNRVPVLVGLPADTSEDELKALGAASASAGSVALFHAAGITPEAPTLDAATGSAPQLPVERIKVADMVAVADRLCPVEKGARLSAVCLGTPHFSFTEFQRLAKLVAGRKSCVEVYVSTSRDISAEIKQQDWFHHLESFGVTLVVDTCTYLAPVVRNSDGVILTNSAKWAHYGPGNLHRRAGLKSMEECIRSAEQGYVI